MGDTKRAHLPKIIKPCVYILRTDKPNVFKVGRTIDRGTRTRAARTWNPDLVTFDIIETETPDQANACESYLHNKLQSKRYAGEFFCVEQPEIEHLIHEVRDYLLTDFLPKKLEVENLAKQPTSDQMLTPGRTALDVYHELLKVREQYYEMQNKKEHLENRLRLLIGTASGLAGVATWKMEEWALFNRTKFQIDHPELYEFYCEKSYVRKLKLLKFKSKQ